MSGQFGSVCHTLRMLGRGVLHDSAYLYVVILTIKCAIYALYVDFLLFWLHLSSHGIHHPSQTPKEATP
jgi:hypothetical protein